MELIIFIITGLSVYIIILLARVERGNKKPTKKNQYKYQTKYRVMTSAELSFYKKLRLSINTSEDIIPQAHLSMFLDHKIKGQNWRGAFSQINGKSVDFLVVDRETQAPIYAIELDDFSHSQTTRIARDALVNNILLDAKLPLIRFAGNEWSTPERITEKIHSSLGVHF